MKKLFENVINNKPLVHHMTNYVTVNDCANMTLAANGAPLMADDCDEVEDIVAISSVLYINIGTLNQRTIASMVKAGLAANRKGIPVVLDPVGVGASDLRNEACKKLIASIDFAVIKGNLSEIRALYYQTKNTGGVDVQESDLIIHQDKEQLHAEIMTIAKHFNCVMLVSGQVDLVANAQGVVENVGGHPIMGRITGTGCMLGSVVATFVAANADNVFDASLLAVKAASLSGERAAKKTEDAMEGTASFKRYFIDAMSMLVPEDFEV